MELDIRGQRSIGSPIPISASLFAIVETSLCSSLGIHAPKSGVLRCRVARTFDLCSIPFKFDCLGGSSCAILESVITTFFVSRVELVKTLAHFFIQTFAFTAKRALNRAFMLMRTAMFQKSREDFDVVRDHCHDHDCA